MGLTGLLVKQGTDRVARQASSVHSAWGTVGGNLTKWPADASFYGVRKASCCYRAVRVLEGPPC